VKLRVASAITAMGVATWVGLPAPAAAQAPPGQGQAAPRMFVVAGARTDADLARLQAAPAKAPGAGQVQARLQPDGTAIIRVFGAATDDALAAAAKASGFELKPFQRPGRPGGQPGAGYQLFSVTGTPTPQDEEKLRQALARVEGIGEFQLRRTPRGLMLGVPAGKVKPETVLAAAKAAGFDLQPVPGGPGQAGGRVGPDGQVITPPAPGERIQQDLTRVGDPAPDFTLITRDGKSKVALSDYRGKKPVVLLFGSYT
jgi:hypothetical protein